MLLAEKPDADAALIRRIRQRDPLALADIYDRYGQPLFSLFLRVTTSQETAEYLVQELFFRVWHGHRLFHPEKESIKQWLFAMARILVTNHIKPIPAGPAQPSNNKLDLEDRGCDSHHCQPVSPVGQDINVEIAGCRVRKSEKLILDLACFYGYSQIEIAELLQRPLEKINYWTRSGVLHSRQSLEVKAK